MSSGGEKTLATSPLDTREQDADPAVRHALVTDRIAGVRREPSVYSRSPVPREAVEILTHRMEAALAGAEVDGLVNGILTNALEPEVL